MTDTISHQIIAAEGTLFEDHQVAQVHGEFDELRTQMRRQIVAPIPVEIPIADRAALHEASIVRAAWESARRYGEVYEFPVIDFNAYRELCDAGDPSFRALGIIVDPAAYEAAQSDYRTRWGSINGVRIPWLVPIEYAPGYDAPRSHELTGKDDVLFLSVPYEVLHDVDISSSEPLPPDTAILIETPESHYDLAKAALGSIELFRDLHGEEFLDLKIRREANRPASMSMFEASLLPTDEYMVGSAEPTMASAWGTYQQQRFEASNPVDRENEAVLFTGPELLKPENGDLMDQLWAICESRFGELGEYHPVSMEESREFFTEFLVDQGTTTIVKFEKGRPVSFGFFMDNLDNCIWLSDSFRQQKAQEALDRGQSILYYPEIISAKGDHSQSQFVLKLHARLTAMTQRPLKLLFESTNRSAGYVPILVTRYIGASGALRIEDSVKEIDKLHYWYLTSDSSD